MRRVVLMLGLAALAAIGMPLTADAGGSTRSEVAVVGAQAQGANFTLGGQPCSLIPVPAADGAAPVGAAEACPGVRPGGQVQTDIGLCTFNFLFTALDGNRYIGTAGHCILGVPEPTEDGSPEDQVGEKVYPVGGGPEALVGGERVGEFAYAVLEDPKDFALIRLDPGVEASPEMCHFGGPTGTNTDVSADTVTLEYFGRGVGVGTALPARSGVALGLPSPDHVYGFGVAVPGDSGSGVISSDGRAVGVLVTTGLHGLGFDDNGIDAGTMGITRLAPQVARAQEALGTTLTLQTAG